MGKVIRLNRRREVDVSVVLEEATLGRTVSNIWRKTVCSTLLSEEIDEFTPQQSDPSLRSYCCSTERVKLSSGSVGMSNVED